MWTGILLACSVYGQCRAISGPAYATEQECQVSLLEGVAEIEDRFPSITVLDYICYQWGKDA